MSRSRLILAPVLLSALLVVPAGAVSSAAAPSPGLSWEPCGERPGAECAELAVPLDWAHPEDGRTVTLAVTRRVATSPAARVGTLFYNPGGPGVGAAAYVRDYDTYAFSPKLRENFDLIGVDPRGVAGSEQIHCGLPVHDPAVSRFPRDRAGYDRLVAYNRAVGESCPGLVGFMDTDSVARDLDAVRAALGEERVSYLGASYGTMLGTAYAELHPERVAAMVLDGAVDRGAPAATLVADATTAVEDAFTRFADWCAATPACALHGEDVPAVWGALVSESASTPLPVPDEPPMTAEELRGSVYAALNLAPGMWPQLATGIAEARAGTPTFLATIRAEALDPARTAAYRAVLCKDIDPAMPTYKDFRRRLATTLAASPHMRGTSEFWDMTAGCLGWPEAPRPRTPVTIEGTPPILIIGTTHDPATPLTWSRRLTHTIPAAHLLTVNGDGHTAYTRSPCATTHADTYLTTGTLPPEGTVCEGA